MAQKEKKRKLGNEETTPKTKWNAQTKQKNSVKEEVAAVFFVFFLFFFVFFCFFLFFFGTRFQLAGPLVRLESRRPWNEIG